MSELPSLLGLAIQTVGILLVALLCGSLAVSVQRRYFSLWAMAWGVLALALAALFLGLHHPALPTLESLYCLGEYGFGILLVLGARMYGGRRALRAHEVGGIVAAALALAVAVPRIDAPFSLRFIAQAVAMASAFAIALGTLWPLRRAGAGPGLRITLVALALLVLDFGHYVPVLTWSVRAGVPLPVAYSAYTSIYDLLLEVLLGFGMVMLVMEDVQSELSRTNQELRAARDRVLTLARQDPLTDCLNRHALYSLMEDDRRERVPAGMVAVVDVDDLKPINDRWGHAAGDRAIRAVAAAIRGVIRADDLLFRWGGDEFLVVLFGLDAVEASRRLAGLRPAWEPGEGSPGGHVSVSWGVAVLGRDRPFEKAIEAADAAMYLHKQARKRGRAAS